MIGAVDQAGWKTFKGCNLLWSVMKKMQVHEELTDHCRFRVIDRLKTNWNERREAGELDMDMTAELQTSGQNRLKIL